MSRNLIIIVKVLLCTFIIVSPCSCALDEEARSSLIVSSTPDLKQNAKTLCNEIAKGSIDKAAKGITDILCWSTFVQRKQTVEVFGGECENRNLLDGIKGLKNITDEMANLMEFMLSNPSQIYATIIQNIASGVYDDNGLISYIVCSLNKAEKADLAKVFPNDRSSFIILIKEYTLLFTVSTVLTEYGNKHGEEYKRVLLEICLAECRDKKAPEIKDNIVDPEVKRLRETNGIDFIKAVKEMFRKYSNDNLKKILRKYTKTNGSDLSDKIWEIFPPREKEAFWTLAGSIEYLPIFYAKLLHHFLKEESIDGEFHAINYIITIRTEIDLENIFREYRALYSNADLLNDIKERFGADKVYCETITILVGFAPRYSQYSVEYLNKSED